MKRSGVRVFILALLFFAGCLSNQPVEKKDIVFTKIITANNFKKAKLFDIANRWLSDNFKSSKAVVEYSDKDSGVIMGNYTYEVSGIGAMALYYYDMAENKITLNFKDNAVKITITQNTIRIKGQGQAFWRSPVKEEFNNLKFNENCIAVADSFEDYIKNFDKNSTW